MLCTGFIVSWISTGCKSWCVVSSNKNVTPWDTGLACRCVIRYQSIACVWETSLDIGNYIIYLSITLIWYHTNLIVILNLSPYNIGHNVCSALTRALQVIQGHDDSKGKFTSPWHCIALTDIKLTCWNHLPLKDTRRAIIIHHSYNYSSVIFHYFAITWICSLLSLQIISCFVLQRLRKCFVEFRRHCVKSFFYSKILVNFMKITTCIRMNMNSISTVVYW